MEKNCSKPWICPPPQFLADDVRLEDVRLYGRDLLRAYTSLQAFQPFRSAEACCMNWDRMLAEFSAPRRRPSDVRHFFRHLPVAPPAHWAYHQGRIVGGDKQHTWASGLCLCILA
jgi:hypothetical protein